MSSALQRWLVRGAIVVGVILVYLLLQHTVLSPDPVSVDIVDAKRGRVQEVIANTRAGSVEARRYAEISPDVGGRVTAVHVQPGDRVETGTVLVELDAAGEEARRTLAQKELAAARAERERICLEAARAQRELARLTRLADAGLLSTNTLDQAQSVQAAAAAACEAAEANVASLEAGVRVAQVRVAKTRLTAPFPGIVAEVRADPGEWLTPSPPAMRLPAAVEIYDPTTLYVAAPMDEVHAAKLEPGLPVRVTLDSHRGETFVGTIIRVAPYVRDVERQNRTVEIQVQLRDEGFARTLLPGTTADVQVILETREDVLRIPTAALLPRDRVLVLKEGELVEREVETGLRNWDFTEITTGLEVGDQIVISLDREEVQAGVAAEAVTEPDDDPTD